MCKWQRCCQFVAKKWHFLQNKRLSYDFFDGIQEKKYHILIFLFFFSPIHLLHVNGLSWNQVLVKNRSITFKFFVPFFLVNKTFCDIQGRSHKTETKKLRMRINLHDRQINDRKHFANYRGLGIAQNLYMHTYLEWKRIIWIRRDRRGLPENRTKRNIV